MHSEWPSKRINELALLRIKQSYMVNTQEWLFGRGCSLPAAVARFQSHE